MFNNIWGENSSESCTWYCYHYIPHFIILEEIYSEICTNIWEEFLLKALLHIVTIMYPTLSFGKKFILTIVPICGENIHLKGVLDIFAFVYHTVLDIFAIVYHTFMFGKKFIPKIVSIFAKKILLKVVLDIVTIIYPTLLFGKKFIP